MTDPAHPDLLAPDDELDDSDDRVGGDDSTPTGRRRPSRTRALLDWIVVIGVALLVAFLVRTFVLAHFVVEGQSMSTTLHNGDRVFVNKLSYRFHDPRRGDVVVLHPDDGERDRDLIKRVIALPGETIEMVNCEVRIDGTLLVEPYIDPEEVPPGQCGDPIAATLVPDGEVFVMGDNRDESLDSRGYFGTVTFDEIVGRAFVVFWPASDWRWL